LADSFLPKIAGHKGKVYPLSFKGLNGLLLVVYCCFTEKDILRCLQ
jgi:hypothetical protein